MIRVVVLQRTFWNHWDGLAVLQSVVDLLKETLFFASSPVTRNLFIQGFTHQDT